MGLVPQRQGLLVPQQQGVVPQRQGLLEPQLQELVPQQQGLAPQRQGLLVLQGQKLEPQGWPPQQPPQGLLQVRLQGVLRGLQAPRVHSAPHPLMTCWGIYKKVGWDHTYACAGGVCPSFLTS